MKLYKTYDKDPGTAPVWTTSQNEASKAKTAMTKALKDADKPHRDVEYTVVEVPTNREGLVAFLNSAASR